MPSKSSLGLCGGQRQDRAPTQAAVKQPFSCQNKKGELLIKCAAREKDNRLHNDLELSSIYSPGTASFRVSPHVCTPKLDLSSIGLDCWLTAVN